MTFSSLPPDLGQQLGGATEQRRLLGTGAMLCAVAAYTSAMRSRVPRLREELLDLLERPNVPRRDRERTLEVRRRPDLVAEDVAEVAGGLEEELGADRRRDHLEPLALRDRLERERELAHPLVAVGGGVQLLPHVGRKRPAGHRRRRAPRGSASSFSSFASKEKAPECCPDPR